VHKILFGIAEVHVAEQISNAEQFSAGLKKEGGSTLTNRR